MAAVPATITVTFTSNYTGPHRVCYRINNSGTYTCATVVCGGGGASCEYEIGITVDNETCEDVIFDGYVQAECQTIDSEEGRVPFLSTFTPTPSCTRYTVTCNDAGLGSIVITDNGTKYGSAPSVSITGGGGTGATAVAVIGTGEIIDGPVITIAGTDYTPGTYTNVPLLGGSGTGATADITVSGGGSIVSATIVNVGIGYADEDNVTPDPSAMGPSTPTISANFQIFSDEGMVVEVNITNSGSGYTSIPTITIAPDAGVTATADGVLAYCDAFSSAGCGVSGTPVSYGNLIKPGDSVEICSSGAVPTVGAQYTITDNGNCLCECSTYTFTVPDKGGSYSYAYTLCDGEAVIGTISESDSSNYITVCMVNDSFIYTPTGGNDVSPTLSISTPCV
jgi:hypothetical protein